MGKEPQVKLQVFIASTHTGNHGNAGRAFMKLQGLDIGPPRLPSVPLPPETVKNLESDLRDIGFFEWA